jgi:DNA-binding NarL/FixJ family response regulator
MPDYSAWGNLVSCLETGSDQPRDASEDPFGFRHETGQRDRADEIFEPGVPDSIGKLQLTARERDLLKFVARGSKNADIAAALYLSEQTVRNYLSQLYAKLGVKSRVEAMAWLRARNWPG